MTVDEYALELQSPALGFVQEGRYSNAFGQVGYRAIYRNAIYYLWYSVSSTESAFAPDELATAITAPKRWIQRENPYFNRKGNVGFKVIGHSDIEHAGFAGHHVHVVDHRRYSGIGGSYVCGADGRGEIHRAKCSQLSFRSRAIFSWHS
jgi:hypothetical protein